MYTIQEGKSSLTKLFKGAIHVIGDNTRENKPFPNTKTMSETYAGFRKSLTRSQNNKEFLFDGVRCPVLYDHALILITNIYSK